MTKAQQRQKDRDKTNLLISGRSNPSGATSTRAHRAIDIPYTQMLKQPLWPFRLAF
jgi:hypothetical protein